MVDFTKLLPQNQARKLISAILSQGGTIIPTEHACKEMENDPFGPLMMNDVLNVLRHGWMNEPAELVAGTWRYRCHTNRIAVVVAFRSESSLTIVTAWRKGP